MNGKENDMKISVTKTAIAAALGLLLIVGNTANGQEKRKRKEPPQKSQPRELPQKRNVQPKTNVPPRGKVDVPGRKGIPPKRGDQGVQRNGQGPANRGRANAGVGRRWNPGSRGADRGDLFRRRSTNLGRQLRIGVGAGGVRVGVGSRRGYDWRNWRSDYYGRHRWYRGSWNGAWYGRWNDRWQNSWRGYPVAVSFGLTPWGVNRMGYWFGYNNYYNPYYAQPVVIGSTSIDYSQPLVAAPPDYDDNVTLTDFDRARDAFKQQQYERSLTLVNREIAQHPRDATLHEFRALALFALADYKHAAETLNPVLAVGPGWDWPTLRGLYSSVAEYTKHLRALEGFVGEHKDRAYGHFLLGYHYLTTGHDDAARTQFQRTVALAPKDQVSRQLLSMLNQNGKIEQPSLTQTGAGSAIAVDNLVGTWNAKRGDADFSLQLSKDMGFTWTHREGKRSTKVSGVYAINNGTLALEPQAGGVMLANVRMKSKDRMQFQMVGSGAKDPGLTFSR
jgi:tetratricopeptide (TPR) repeat protein